MPFPALIVDDERLARRELREMLAVHTAVQVAGEASSLAEARSAMERAHYSLVFLDVQLGPETGFDLLPHIAAETRVIFVTAYDTYALRAFDVNALDYLLKPVSPERLKAALARLPKAAPAPARPLGLEDRLLLGRQLIAVREIALIVAAGDYSEIVTSAGERMLAAKSMREWDARLPQQDFVRVHRSAIVQLGLIERVDEGFHRALELKLRGVAEPVAVSRRYAGILRERFS